MVDIKSCITSAKTRLLRRSSGLSVKSSEESISGEHGQSPQHRQQQNTSASNSVSSTKANQGKDKEIRTVSTSTLKTQSPGPTVPIRTTGVEGKKSVENTKKQEGNIQKGRERPPVLESGRSIKESVKFTETPIDHLNEKSQGDGAMDLYVESVKAIGGTEKEPIVTIEEPTPEIHLGSDPLSQIQVQTPQEQALKRTIPAALTQKLSHKGRPVPPNLRRQSLVTNTNAKIVQTILDTEGRQLPSSEIDSADNAPSAVYASLLTRRIWVKRPSASATMIQIKEGDLVDDVREIILKKYGNSLGRHYDAPDLTLRIIREQAQKSKERILGPEEDMCRTLDIYYPDGQTVEEALLIDIPQRRTPRPSPRAVQPLYYAPAEDMRPVESGTDYFPPMPYSSSPGAPMTSISHDSRHSQSVHDRSMSVLTTGLVPPLPSPGSSRRSHQNRPIYARKHTSSPTIPENMATTSGVHPIRQSSRKGVDSSPSASDYKVTAPPTPPLATAPPLEPLAILTSNPSSPAVTSPRASKLGKKLRKAAAAAAAEGADVDTASTLPAGVLDSFVPPINVLIVEDNMINLKLLEAFMKRLKVQWKSAMNGRDAVKTWRNGGFHLVLMDIQLPIMSGIDATKEIRRLERVNGIGVFGTAGAVGETVGISTDTPIEGVVTDDGDTGSKEERKGEKGSDGSKASLVDEKDRLGNRSFLRTPVIIVALTASSLQSDRHEALAAGCNDFLTKVRQMTPRYLRFSYHIINPHHLPTPV